VYEVRKTLGTQLAKEHPVDADVVIPVPDSGVPSAIGYASSLGIPFEMGLIRSHYVGRTFIEPQQSIRHFGVRLKLNPVEPILRGKRVVVVDDSIVRGTTARKLVKMVRDAGAREVHLRISSPPTEWPCYYGIDTPTRRELIASSHSVLEIARYVTADSLGYLSIEGMLAAVSGTPSTPPIAAAPPGTPTETGYCHACFSGKYAIPFIATPRKQVRLASV
jgi:amidophosphoribosyltransferase